MSKNINHKTLGKKLESLVLFEIADHPELSIANKSGETGFDLPNYLLSGFIKYQVRVTKRKGFFRAFRDSLRNYALWIESHTLDYPDRDLCRGGSVYFYESRYSELAARIAQRCEEFSNLKYEVREMQNEPRESSLRSLKTKLTS